MNLGLAGRILRKRRLTGLYLEVLAELTLCKALIVWVPFGRWAHRQGRIQSETLREDRSGDLKGILRVQGAIRRLSRWLPWESRCLDQALAVQRLLGRRGLPTTAYYGLIRDEKGHWTAHAWVRCGNVWAIGYPGDKPYTVVGCYARTA
jgi:hypothetical protein